MRSYLSRRVAGPSRKLSRASERLLQRARTHRLPSGSSLNQLRPALIFNGGRRTLFGQPVQYVGATMSKSDAPGILDLFVDPKQQADNMRQWNTQSNFGFTKDDFGPILEAMARLPLPNGLTAPVLVAYLETVGETFEALWSAVESVYAKNYRWDEVKSDRHHLRLLDGIEHPGRCLRWEVIDLGAHHEPENGRLVRNVRGPDSAHAGVLAAAAHFPEWVAAMCGKTVPYVDIAGYQCTVRGDGRWRGVPCICGDGSGVRLRAAWDGNRHYRYAAPVLRALAS